MLLDPRKNFRILNYPGFVGRHVVAGVDTVDVAGTEPVECALHQLDPGTAAREVVPGIAAACRRADMTAVDMLVVGKIVAEAVAVGTGCSDQHNSAGRSVHKRKIVAEEHDVAADAPNCSGRIRYWSRTGCTWSCLRK